MKLSDIVAMPESWRRRALLEGHITLSQLHQSMYQPEDQYKWLFKNLPFDEALDECIEIARWSGYKYRKFMNEFRGLGECGIIPVDTSDDFKAYERLYKRTKEMAFRSIGIVPGLGSLKTVCPECSNSPCYCKQMPISRR